MKRAIILIFAMFLLALPLVFADNLIIRTNTCVFNGSQYNITTAPGPDVVNDGQGSPGSCQYAFKGSGKVITNSSNVVFPTTDNSSWYCIVNMSIRSLGVPSGRGLGIINGSYGSITPDEVAGQWTVLWKVPGAACAGDSICLVVETIRNPFKIRTDVNFYLYNMTYNGSNFSIFNVFPTYHLNSSGVMPKPTPLQNWIFGEPADSPNWAPNVSRFECWNVTPPAPAVPDTTPPNIIYYNLTTDNGCETWNSDKNTACSTSSVTPTVQFNTSENAWCAIAGSSSLTSLDLNYTDIGSSRNCTGAASGEGTREHFCTLTNQDELVYDTSYLFISCKDSSGNQNLTSTSGALKLSITGLETAGRNSIGVGVQNALLSGYTNYTDLQIYARNLSNAQVRGTFDRAVKKGTKMWAFNRIGVSDSHVNMFNLTPVLYTLELANKTSSNITLQVEQLINATK